MAVQGNRITKAEARKKMLEVLNFCGYTRLYKEEDCDGTFRLYGDGDRFGYNDISEDIALLLGINSRHVYIISGDKLERDFTELD